MTQRRDSDALAELMDLAPTCLELAGADWNRREMDAVSLVPVLNGSTEPLRPVQRSELHNCTMLFDGRYKWIRSYNDTDELYDLKPIPRSCTTSSTNTRKCWTVCAPTASAIDL